MSELTLESLAARVAELERKLAASPSIIPASRDWRSVVGMFEGSESMMRVDAEIAARDFEKVPGLRFENWMDAPI